MGLIKDKGRVVEYNDKSLEGWKRSSRGLLFRANERLEHFSNVAAIPANMTLTNTTPVTAATYGTGLGGTAVLTSDDVSGTGALLAGALLWQANRQTAGQPLVYEARVQPGATITTAEYWNGITDATADTDLEALSTTSTFTTSVPTDAALVGFSATPTSGAAFTSGGNNHVAVTNTNDGNTVVGTGLGAFTASTYYIYRVEIDSAGDVAFFVDGQFLAANGYTASTTGVTPTVPLTMICAVIPRATGAGTERIVTIDYMYIGGV